jgi:hypothetical protein
VPEKFPVAWPYTVGEMHNPIAHSIARKNILVLIVTTPFGNPRYCLP